ncbi:GerMN domain-containing protein [Paenibacillus sp. 481]|uniref:GerMN domain-containing protein n=1 Tax=Paenibacillus sp. 481 TaxID=2835869 RepID=UPI001E50CA24|nr:GerMN domain-containing protein [Paenibacillus sp. 481]UHA73021.1 GerMN domain-containing protein [Paenibacillus sp. 481]
MTKQKWWGVAVVLLAVSLMTACIGKETTPNNSGQPTTEGNSQTEQPGHKSEPPKQANKQEKSIQVYVTDDQLMELKSYNKTISFTNEEEKYKAAAEALKQTDQADTIALWENVQFKSIVMKDGTLTLDVHIPQQANLGSGGEQLALDAMTKTIFQFDEVQAIDILIDGKATESLMGHVTLDHPIKRSN